MNLLITGAFGQIGESILNCILINKNLERLKAKFGEINIHCFDLPKKKKRARKFRKFKNIKFTFGDIRDKVLMNNLLTDIDIVIHLAFIIPPIPDKIEPLVRTINIDGLINVLDAIKQNGKKARLIFPTSIDDLGFIPKKDQPVSPYYPRNPIDNYGKHKKECVELIQMEPEIDSLILRLTVVPPLNKLANNPAMFDVSIDEQIELIHEKDVAKAFFNALFLPVFNKRIFNIAGGKKCQMNYYEFVNLLMESSGIGKLEAKLFKGGKIHTAYMNTTESQKLLKYQEHSIDDIVRDLKNNNKFLFFIIRLLRPIVRKFLISQAPK